LEENTEVDTKIKNKDLMKCEISIDGLNLQEKKEEYGTEQQRLLDEYDEDHLSMKSPQVARVLFWRFFIFL
jgi:hypothetical protein